MNNSVRTWLYLVILSTFALTVGGLAAGRQGLVAGFIFSFLMTVTCYLFSDQWLLWTFQGRLVEGVDPYGVRKTISELCQIASIPEPKLYFIPSPTPNVFSMGRSIGSASIVVSEGAVQVLSRDELKGVLAHEISHILNRETFLMTVVSTITGVLHYFVEGIKWIAALGNPKNQKSNSVGGIFEGIIYPFEAALIRAPLRSKREYSADKQAAEMTQNPRALAQALWKMHHHGRALPLPAPPHTAHLFVVSPLQEGNIRLFETHPPVQERIKRLIGRSL
ncbi:MAG: M48 family metalloprotease [Oligoflexia bacterium]|nr:M48 family metalloprotease [Oligoflexia bacterium]